MNRRTYTLVLLINLMLAAAVWADPLPAAADDGRRAFPLEGAARNVVDLGT